MIVFHFGVTHIMGIIRHNDFKVTTGSDGSYGFLKAFISHQVYFEHTDPHSVAIPLPGLAAWLPRLEAANR
jgi:hypothetical protein